MKTQMTIPYFTIDAPYELAYRNQRNLFSMPDGIRTTLWKYILQCPTSRMSS